MKFDLKNWAENKKRILFLIVCPMALSTAIDIFVGPVVLHASPRLALLTPLLAILVFVPFAIIDARRQKAVNARENSELQAKYDAEDTATFGRPLREVKL